MAQNFYSSKRQGGGCINNKGSAIIQSRIGLDLLEFQAGWGGLGGWGRERLRNVVFAYFIMIPVESILWHYLAF